MLFAILAPPFWDQIERMSHPDKRELYTALRQVYGSAMANGPFSIIIGHSGGMIGLADRAKLRPLVAARSGDLFLLASEESAIRSRRARSRTASGRRRPASRRKGCCARRPARRGCCRRTSAQRGGPA